MASPWTLCIVSHQADVGTSESRVVTLLALGYIGDDVPREAIQLRAVLGEEVRRSLVLQALSALTE